MEQPWELNPALTAERLKQLASLIRDVRDDVVDLHNDDLGDTSRSTGLRAYECCRVRIIRAAAQQQEWPWLGIIKVDGKFTFSIGSVPVRLYRGRPSCPEERRLIPCVEALSQMSLLPTEIGDAASIIWLFAVEVDEFRYVERVSITGFLDGSQVSSWEIPLDERVPAVGSIDAKLPESIKTPKAPISVKRKDKKAENDDSNNGS
ncbi:hypothetical protein [Providencia hangzhouensis]|uniref:hypothetical protein n=1 Tax=Providencia hangzhouensis TaxID=3031799 RepID=UPI0034DCEDA0